MHIPMENPLLQFLYFLVDTPGLGGIAVAMVGSVSITAYFFVLRWIRNGAKAEEAETYTYPTPTLTHSKHD
jgi:hypothetical protein